MPTYSLPDAVVILSRTPEILRAWLLDVPEPWLVSNEGEGTWNAMDILGHLVHGEEDDWIPRARHLLEKGESEPWAPFDRDAMFVKFAGWNVRDLLDRFDVCRREGLETLREWRLSENDLDRTAIHPEFGRVTLRQHLATWVTHDLGHMAQVARVMAKRYRDDVGPWRQYIPILDRRSG